MRQRRDSYHSIQRDLRVIYFYRYSGRVDAAVCLSVSNHFQTTKNGELIVRGRQSHHLSYTLFTAIVIPFIPTLWNIFCLTLSSARSFWRNYFQERSKRCPLTSTIVQHSFADLPAFHVVIGCKEESSEKSR